jgi:thymidylate synthase (FAD)
MPKSFDNLTDADNEHFYRQRMKYYARFYQDALDAGIKPEDARYLLPEATKTKIVVTMNLRELFHFFDTRNSQRAQWEIRDLAKAMHDALLDNPEWCELITMYDETGA